LQRSFQSNGIKYNTTKHNAITLHNLHNNYTILHIRHILQFGSMIAKKHTVWSNKSKIHNNKITKKSSQISIFFDTKKSHLGAKMATQNINGHSKLVLAVKWPNCTIKSVKC